MAARKLSDALGPLKSELDGPTGPRDREPPSRDSSIESRRRLFRRPASKLRRRREQRTETRKHSLIIPVDFVFGRTRVRAHAKLQKTHQY